MKQNVRCKFQFRCFSYNLKLSLTCFLMLNSKRKLREDNLAKWKIRIKLVKVFRILLNIETKVLNQTILIKKLRLVNHLPIQPYHRSKKNHQKSIQSILRMIWYKIIKKKLSVNMWSSLRPQLIKMAILLKFRLITRFQITSTVVVRAKKWLIRRQQVKLSQQKTIH